MSMVPPVLPSLLPVSFGRAPEVPAVLLDAIRVASKRFEDTLLLFAVARRPTNPASMMDYEADLHAQVARECLDPFVGVTIQAAHEAPAVQERVADLRSGIPHLAAQRSGEGVKVTLRGGSEFEVITPYGLVRPPRGPGHPRRPGSRKAEGNGVYPVLVALGIHFRVTPSLASEVARLVATGTYDDAFLALDLRGVKLSRKRIERIARRVGDQALSYRSWVIEQTRAGYRGAGQVARRRLVIGTDGGRLRIRKTKAGRRRKSGRHGFDPEWREPRVLVVYEIDAKGKKKRKGFLRYEATMGDADETFELLTALLRDIGAQEADEWIFTADGATWIADRIPALVEALDYDPSRVTEVLDRYHATEYLTKIAEGRKGWSDEERKHWVKRMKTFLHRGQIERILEQKPLLCVGRNAKAQGKLFRYLEKRVEKMRYAEFRRRGIPCGSGAIESCVRRVINLRLKGAGIFWTEEMAERVLHLRAHLQAGHWNEYMRTIMDHEALREPAALADAA